MVRLVVVRRMINFVGRNDLLPEIGPNDSIVIHDTGYIISMTNDSGSYKV